MYTDRAFNTPPPQPPNSWKQSLEGLHNRWLTDRDRIEVDDRSSKLEQKEMHLWLPSASSSTWSEVHSVLVDASRVWREHPEVSGVYLSCHFWNLEWDSPDVAVCGSREPDGFRWVVDSSQAQRVIWLPRGVSPRTVQERIRETRWEEIWAFSPGGKRGWSSRHVQGESLEDFLVKILSRPSTEVELWILEGFTTRSPARRRGALERQFYAARHDLHERWRKGLWVDLGWSNP